MHLCHTNPYHLLTRELYQCIALSLFIDCVGFPLSAGSKSHAVNL